MFTLRKLFLAAALMAPATPVFADVISDWNEKAVTFLTAKMLPPPQAERTMAMVNVAMFDAVNAIERRYRPYLLQLPASPALPKEAAAAAAAGTILAGLYAPAASEFKSQMATYLETVPDGETKSRAIELGEAVAARILAARMPTVRTHPIVTGQRPSPASIFRPRPLWLPCGPRSSRSPCQALRISDRSLPLR